MSSSSPRPTPASHPHISEQQRAIRASILGAVLGAFLWLVSRRRNA